MKGCQYFVHASLVFTACSHSMFHLRPQVLVTCIDIPVDAGLRYGYVLCSKWVWVLYPLKVGTQYNAIHRWYEPPGISTDQYCIPCFVFESVRWWMLAYSHLSTISASWCIMLLSRTCLESLLKTFATHSFGTWKSRWHCLPRCFARMVLGTLQQSTMRNKLTFQRHAWSVQSWNTHGNKQRQNEGAPPLTSKDFFPNA